MVVVLLHRHGAPILDAAVRAATMFGGLGLLICSLGVVLAVEVRMVMGRNWGVPMSCRHEPDLLTSGPNGWYCIRYLEGYRWPA